MMQALLEQKRRPFLILVIVVLGVCAPGLVNADYLSWDIVYSALQSLSVVGMVALGLSLTILIGEFDLSLAGVFGLSGCIAVIVGNTNPAGGMLIALCLCVAFGVLQGTLIAFARIGSVPITLGGLLITGGLAYVITGNRTISFDDIDLSLWLNEPVFRIFSFRSVVTLALFLGAAIFFKVTRIGRDLVATGSDRKASVVSGVSVKLLIIGSFAFSSSMAAISGAMLSFGLASASPSGLSDVLVPAIAAAILGGVSLAGGTGTPMGVLAGALTLATLRSGLNALAAPSFVNDLVTGAILFIVAITDAPLIMRRVRQMISAFRGADA